MSDGEEDYARLDGKVASLSAVLLARKGAAAPSLKRFARERAKNPFTESCEKAETCPIASAPVREKRVAMTLRLPIPEFLRLKLAAANFQRTSQAILMDALRAYLDDKGVESFDACQCLNKAEAEGPRQA